jgi:hypothetical protein
LKRATYFVLCIASLAAVLSPPSAYATQVQRVYGLPPSKLRNHGPKLGLSLSATYQRAYLQLSPLNSLLVKHNRLPVSEAQDYTGFEYRAYFEDDAILRYGFGRIVPVPSPLQNDSALSGHYFFADLGPIFEVSRRLRYSLLVGFGFDRLGLQIYGKDAQDFEEIFTARDRPIFLRTSNFSLHLAWLVDWVLIVPRLGTGLVLNLEAAYRATPGRSYWKDDKLRRLDDGPPVAGDGVFLGASVGLSWQKAQRSVSLRSQSSRSCKVLYFLPGFHALELSRLNSLLAVYGLNPFSDSFLSLGAAYGKRRKRTLLSLEVNKLFAEESGAALNTLNSLSGSHLFLMLGQEFNLRRRLSLIPFVGLGYGRLAMNLRGEFFGDTQDLLTAPGKDLSLSASGLLYKFSLLFDAMPNQEMLGLRLDYIWAGPGWRWRSEGVELAGDSRAGLEGWQISYTFGGRI